MNSIEDIQNKTFSKDQLIDCFVNAETPEATARVGVEYELLAFRAADHRPLPYAGRTSVHTLLAGMQAYGWAPATEAGNLVGLKSERSGAAISLEPCGQVELASSPFSSLHALASELNFRLGQLRSAAAETGVQLVALGFNPLWGRDALFWIPRMRYQIMRNYMPRVGRRGLDMMSRACAIQVNLDFSSEQDMVHKYRLALALQPVVSALFANSPFTDDALADRYSVRNEVWTQTDPDRCGIPAFIFDDDMGYERYVDYALDVPMYSVQRGLSHLDLAGQSFRRFLDGDMPGLDGERPSIADFKSHLNTLMPEVRAKHVLEIRGADSGPPWAVQALAALWVGLLYEPRARAEVRELVAPWPAAEWQRLWRETPVRGLEAELGGRPIAELAGRVVEIARAGLQRRELVDAHGKDESCYLDPVDELLEQRQSERLTGLYHGPWGGAVEPVLETNRL